MKLSTAALTLLANSASFVPANTFDERTGALRGRTGTDAVEDPSSASSVPPIDAELSRSLKQNKRAERKKARRGVSWRKWGKETKVAELVEPQTRTSGGMTAAGNKLHPDAGLVLGDPIDVGDGGLSSRFTGTVGGVPQTRTGLIVENKLPLGPGADLGPPIHTGSGDVASGDGNIVVTGTGTGVTHRVDEGEEPSDRVTVRHDHCESLNVTEKKPSADMDANFTLPESPTKSLCACDEECESGCCHNAFFVSVGPSKYQQIRACSDTTDLSGCVSNGGGADLGDPTFFGNEP